MKFKYVGRSVEVNDAMREYAEKKINKLDWFFGDEADVQVKFEVAKGGRQIAEITIMHRGMIFRAEESAQDIYASIDSAVDKLTGQIRRHRTKLDKKFRSPAPAPAPEFITEEERALVRIKKFKVEAMSVEDAITQLEQLGHSFYMFNNSDTGTMCVVYVRKDGNYGLLEPEA